ncbi:MAG: DUF523 domain-containing protein [Magnetococcales bacterium]|nr:DUF523 domain-containing protein [Magnetococcales bacterium]
MQNLFGKTEPLEIKIGISACLLGEPVRYDGQDKAHGLLCALSAQGVTFIPICPEVGCGLGVPREAMQLEGDPETARLITCHSRQDKTDQLSRWCQVQITHLPPLGLSAIILKSRSPSCGHHSTKIVVSPTDSVRGSGLFAQQLERHLPDLPLFQESDFTDAHDLQRLWQRISDPQADHG